MEARGTGHDRIEKRLRIAGGLVIGGLAVEGLSLLGLHHPWGFLSFATIGGVLVAAGVLVYLWSLVA